MHITPASSFLGLLTALLATASFALEPGDDMAGAAPEGGVSIASCVEGGPPLTLATGDVRAMLEPADRDLVLAAALARFPVLQRQGLDVEQILLWNRSSDEWLYVSLVRGLAGWQSPCFTATFAAGAFEFSAPMIQKYFPGAGRI